MMRLVYILLFFAMFPEIMLNAQNWQTFANADSLYNPGGYATVEALHSDGTNLYVGGGFRKTGNLDIPGVVKWDGNHWVKMGIGIDDANVVTIEKFQGKIYIGGFFADINGIQNSEGIGRFNGTNWEPLPNTTGNLFGNPYEIKEFDSLLIIGGAGFYVNGALYWRVVAHNGLNYVYYGATPDDVLALEVYNGEIYAGGVWYSMQKKVGNSWIDVGGQCSYYIQDLEVDTFNNFLYVGGGFNVVDDSIISDNVAIWNGHYWEKFGTSTGYINDVMRLKYYHGRIYAGLSTSSIGGCNTGFLAMWDGQTWLPVADTLKWPTAAMEIYKDTLWVGGYWYYENGVNIGTLGKWFLPPDTTCNYLQPRAFALDDTLTLWQGHAGAQFYNNNAYAESWYWDFGDGNFSTDKDPLHDYTSVGLYDVSVTVSHAGCTKTATNQVLVSINTGNENLTDWDYGFKVYPNPTTGEINVECNLPPSVIGEIRTFNIYGSMIETHSLQSGKNILKIQSEQVPKGISLCALYINGKQVIIEKVIKN